MRPKGSGSARYHLSQVRKDTLHMASKNYGYGMSASKPQTKVKSGKSKKGY